MMEELRNFITTDNHEAVKIGDLEKNTGIASSGETTRITLKRCEGEKKVRHAPSSTPQMLETKDGAIARGCVRGSYSAMVPRSSSARVHREFVHPGRQS